MLSLMDGKDGTDGIVCARIMPELQSKNGTPRSDSVFTPSVIYLILMSTIYYIQTKSNKP